MIILITGASHVGKTILAQRMLEKYKYPYYSIDHLKMGERYRKCISHTQSAGSGDQNHSGNTTASLFRLQSQRLFPVCRDET